MNLVVLQGRLGKDPEVRYGQSGNAYTNISVATSERRKDRDGNWVEDTQWHRVTAFGKTAENVGKYLVKGSSVLIEGSIKYDQYQDKDGNNRTSTSIMARRVNFLSAPAAKGSHGPSSGPQQRPSFQGYQQQGPQGGNQQQGPQGGNNGFQGRNQSQGDFSNQNGFGDDDDIPF